MKSKFVLFTSGILVTVSLQAYIILDSKTTVSPGCDGGVLSHKCTSYINYNDLKDSKDHKDQRIMLNVLDEEARDVVDE